ncbi:hypothetical protein D3C81_1421900 [compost metagenome]
MRVRRRQCHDLGSHILSQGISEVRSIGQNDLLNPGNLAGSRSRGLSTVAGDKNMDLSANFGSCADRVIGCAFELAVVVLGNHKCRHSQITLASFFSLSSRVATSGTRTPGLRATGSSTRRVFRRGLGSTLSDAAVSTSSGFFFAFMMFGSVT